jgi:hypothetical protein
MILAAVASYDLQAFDALQRVNARGTFVVNQQASLQLRDGGAIVVAFLVSEDGRWVNGQVIRANGVIGSQTQGHGPGISRVRGTARSATLIRSTSTPGGHHEHH